MSMAGWRPPRRDRRVFEGARQGREGVGLRDRTAWSDSGWSHCGRAKGRRPLLMAAVVTPRRGGLVDHAGFEANLRYQTSSGLDGILVAGTTGENERLTANDRDALIRSAAATVDEDVLIVSGIQSGDPESVIDDAERTRAHGADLVLVPPPFSADGDRDEANLASYVDTVVQGASLPVLFYHPPSFSGAPLGQACVREVRAVPGLAGVKDSLGDAAVLEAWLEAKTDRFAVFVGSARLFRDTAPYVTGGILALASVLPTRWLEVAIMKAAGEPTEALEAELEEDIRLHEEGRIPALKRMHEEKGLCGGE